MTITRPDLVNLPSLTNPTNEQTEFVVQDSGVNQKLTAQRTREFLGNQIGPTGPQGPQGVQGPQGPQGVQGPTGPTTLAYSTSTATPQNFGAIVLQVSTSNHSFVQGNRVVAINSASNFFEGFLDLSPDRLTFTISADYNRGNITTNSWVISLTGQIGATGPQGPQGVQGPTGPSFRVTSVTTATPTNVGSITLVANTSNHAFITGQRVIAINAVNNFFEGVVTIVAGVNFFIAADYNIGSTTANSWTIGLAGQKGATGPQGPQGVTGPTGPVFLVRSSSNATPDGVSLTTMVVDNANHLFVQGLRVAVINTNSNFFEGTITNAVTGGTTFIIQQRSFIGGTPASDWYITLAGKEGPQGPQGPASTFALTAGSLTGGTTGSIAIQAATSVTAFIAPGSNNNLLQYSNNTASWVSTSTIIVGTAQVTDKVLANQYSNVELSPSKYVAIIDFVGTNSGSDIGIQTSLAWNNNQEKLTLPNLNVSNNATSTGTAYGPLTVSGGVGIGGNLNIAGATIVYSTASANSTASGALQVKGGVGIGGDLIVGGEIISQKLTIELTTITTTLVTTDDIIKTVNTTNAVSSTTGALQVAGGAGIEKNVYIGGNLNVGGLISGVLVGAVTSATNLVGGTTGQIPYQSTSGVTLFTGPGNAGEILTSRGAGQPIYQNTLTLSGTANNLGFTNSGALQVVGGAGIGRRLTVGEDLFVRSQGQIGMDLVTGDLLVLGGLYTNAFRIYAPNINDKLIYTVGTLTIATTSTGPGNGLTIDSTGTVNILNTSSATNIFNGSLRVGGGASVKGDLHVGGNIYPLGSLVGGASSVQTIKSNSPSVHYLTFVDSNNDVATTETLYTTASITINPLLGNMGLMVNSSTQLAFYNYNGYAAMATASTANNMVFLLGTSPFLAVSFAISTSSYIWNYTNVTDTAGTNSGAVIVAGGVGIGKGLNIGGITTVTNTTNALSTTSGALQVRGGAGISQDLYVGGTIYGNLIGGGGVASSALVVSNVSTSDHFITFVDSNNAAPNTETFYTTATLAVTPSSGNFKVLSVTNSTGTNTGALQVRGGAGIHLDLYVGGQIYGSITTATNIKGGSAGVLVIQTATDRTGFAGPGTGGDVLVSQGAVTGGPVFQNTLTLAGITSATSTLTGALQVKGGVGIGGSMYLNGYLQVGFASTAYSTGTNGEIRATNEITAYFSSDINLKENITLIEEPLTLINQIRGVYFDWKDSYIESRGGEDGYFVRKNDVGVIAQEIENILPHIVATRPDGFKAVKYEKLVPLLIESIKHLHQEIETIKKLLK